MRRFVTLIALAVLFLPNLGAQTAENLAYTVEYHWGFIRKTAGSGRVDISVSGDTLHATLDGHSIPWGGRRYTVNDTLTAVIAGAPAGSSDYPAEQVLYINGRYTKPLVSLDAQGNEVVTPTDLYKNIHGQGTLNADASTMEAVTITAQMLALYRYATLFPFDSWQSGQTLTIPIDMPQGPDETLSVTYNGTGDAPGPDGIPVNAYLFDFTYTYQGRPSGYNVSCAIDPDTRYPLLISADLPIGHLEMLLVK